MPDRYAGGHSAQITHSMPVHTLSPIGSQPSHYRSDYYDDGSADYPIYTTDLTQGYHDHYESDDVDKGTYKLLISLDKYDETVLSRTNPGDDFLIVQKYEGYEDDYSTAKVSHYNRGLITGPMRTSQTADAYNRSAKVHHHHHPHKHGASHDAEDQYVIIPQQSDIFRPMPAGNFYAGGSGGHSARVLIGGERNETIRLPLGLPANVTTQHLNPPDESAFSGISEPAPVPVDLQVDYEKFWRKDLPTTVLVYTASMPGGIVTADTIAPSGYDVKVPEERFDRDRSIHYFTFIPSEKGTWKIRVFTECGEIQQSPYYMHVYDPTMARVIGNQPSGLPGVPYTFEVDTVHVGHNEIEVSVMFDCHRVPHGITLAGSHRHTVTFTPLSPGLYRVNVFMGGAQAPVDVAGSPFDVTVEAPEAPPAAQPPTPVPEPVPAPELHVELEKHWRIATPTTIDVYAGNEGEVTAEAIAPSGTTSRIHVYDVDRSLGVHHVKFIPSEKGVWKIRVFRDGVEARHSPYYMRIYDPALARIIDNPSTGQLATPYNFEVDCLYMGYSDVDVQVTHEGRNILNQVIPVGADRSKVTFTPPDPGVYRVNVIVGNTKTLVDVAGSPFEMKVEDPAPSKPPVVVPEITGPVDLLVQLERVWRIAKATNIVVMTGGVGDGVVTTEAVAPSASAFKLPVRTVDKQRGMHKMELIPSEKGVWKIRVFYDEVEVKQSPYYMRVYDPSLARIMGNGPTAKPGELYTFEVDTLYMGYSEILVNVIYDQQHSILNQIIPIGADRSRVTFTPLNTGVYMVQVMVHSTPAPVDVAGSPFQVNVESPASPAPVAPPAPTGPVDLHIEYFKYWRVGACTTLKVYTGGVGNGEVSAESISPSGHPSKIAVFQVCPHRSERHIEFTPSSKGVWKVRVLYEGVEVRESPVSIIAYDPSLARIINNKHVSDPGSDYVFEVDCSQVGFSEIDVNVHCNGKTVPSDIVRIGADRSQVRFKPTESGVYHVNVYMGGQQIPVDIAGSPFHVRCYAVGELQESVRVTSGHVVTGEDGISQGVIDQLLTFDVDIDGQPGRKFCVTVVSPSNATVTPKIDHKGQRYTVSFTPKEAGDYVVELTYNDKQVAKSPYKMNIRQPRIYVRNLQTSARLKQRHTFEVDASEHATGTIEVDTDLAVVDYREVHPRVYSISFQPASPGRHEMILRFMGKHIRGSPYVINVNR